MTEEYVYHYFSKRLDREIKVIREFREEKTKSSDWKVIQNNGQ